ncbi:hypothetical protein V6N11_080312 [Hibiscus sabdariffa]|uniref:Uncharacterized protein n=1 Tax=Hibiscus sabdariffa TaxID=183260 RepID=A0ABR2R7C4_9ROSI
MSLSTNINYICPEANSSPTETLHALYAWSNQVPPISLVNPGNEDNISRVNQVTCVGSESLILPFAFGELWCLHFFRGDVSPTLKLSKRTINDPCSEALATDSLEPFLFLL